MYNLTLKYNSMCIFFHFFYKLMLLYATSLFLGAGSILSKNCINWRCLYRPQQYEIIFPKMMISPPPKGLTPIKVNLFNMELILHVLGRAWP